MIDAISCLHRFISFFFFFFSTLLLAISVSKACIKYLSFVLCILIISMCIFFNDVYNFTEQKSSDTIFVSIPVS
jgi:hypothetical protein